MKEEDLMIETETTFDEVDFGMVCAVITAWWKGSKLMIKNPHTRLTMTDETKSPRDYLTNNKEV